MGHMGILDRWSQYRERKKRQRQKESSLVDLIERMVQDSDPSVRKVAGYRREQVHRGLNVLATVSENECLSR
jgi:hypothetical protein